MLVVDANVWLAAANPNEPSHADAIAFMAAAAGEDFICPTLLLIEVAGAAARRSRDPKEGMQLATQVANDPRIRWEPLTTNLMHSGFMLASSLFLRGADATYATVADLHNAPLITLDADLEIRAGGYVQAMSPGKWVALHTSPTPPPP